MIEADVANYCFVFCVLQLLGREAIMELPLARETPEVCTRFYSDTSTDRKGFVIWSGHIAVWR